MGEAKPAPFPKVLSWVLAALAIAVLISALINGDSELAIIFLFNSIGGLTSAVMNTIELEGTPKRIATAVTLVAVVGLLVTFIRSS